MLGAALAWTAGCGKKEEPTTTVEDTQKAADTVAGEMEKTADTAKAAAEKAAGEVKEQAPSAVAAASAKAQEVIDKAKSLVGENKYQDALTALQGLAGMKLSDEQQKIVDGLKKQIQDALAKKAASEATSAAGNVLGGEK